MNHFPVFSSRAIHLPLKDIDTDMIFPARFLTTTDKDKMKEKLFRDLRDQQQDFPFNHPTLQEAKLLITGENFGCGSSREHAVWALKDWGIKAIIAPKFADIFASNAEKNGLLLIVFPAETIVALTAAYEREDEFTVNLEEQFVRDPNGKKYPFAISKFAKKRLQENMNELDYLMSFKKQIQDFENQRKPFIPFVHQ